MKFHLQILPGFFFICTVFPTDWLYWSFSKLIKTHIKVLCKFCYVPLTDETVCVLRFWCRVLWVGFCNQKVGSNWSLWVCDLTLEQPQFRWQDIQINMVFQQVPGWSKQWWALGGGLRTRQSVREVEWWKCPQASCWDLVTVVCHCGNEEGMLWEVCIADELLSLRHTHSFKL